LRDDLVGIKLATFTDSRLAYPLFFNPHGIQDDVLISLTKSGRSVLMTFSYAWLN